MPCDAVIKGMIIVGEREISASSWLQIKLFTMLKVLSSCATSPIQTRSLPLTIYVQLLESLLTKSLLLACLDVSHDSGVAIHGHKKSK